MRWKPIKRTNTMAKETAWASERFEQGEVAYLTNTIKRNTGGSTYCIHKNEPPVEDRNQWSITDYVCKVTVGKPVPGKIGCYWVERIPN